MPTGRACGKYFWFVAWIWNVGSLLSAFTQAYPLPDDSVRDHLLRAPSVDNELKVNQYLQNFLSSLFITARLQIQDLFPGNGMMTYEEIVKTFYEFFKEQPQRLKFYDQVVRHARRSKHSLNSICGHSIDQFTSDLERRCSNWPTNLCPILISIDEVHILYTPRKNKDKQSVHSLYSRFKWVLSNLVLCKFGVICMSTAIPTTIDNPTPPQKKIPTFWYVRAREIVLPAPITELPFDVDLSADPLNAGRETLESINSLEFTARFGRPL